MSDPLKKIDKLAKASRAEMAPSVDVSGRVLALIREREAAYGYAPLQWIALGSSVAATAMVLSVLWLYETWSDPLNKFFLDLVLELL